MKQLSRLEWIPMTDDDVEWVNNPGRTKMGELV